MSVMYTAASFADSSLSTKSQFLRPRVMGLIERSTALYQHLDNAVENEIRPVTLGWKNYLFCGNHEAAQNMAVVCSLKATCRNHDVNPRDYLNDVISQMPYHAKASYEELLQLLSHKWKLTHPESVMTKTA